MSPTPAPKRHPRDARPGLRVHPPPVTRPLQQPTHRRTGDGRVREPRSEPARWSTRPITTSGRESGSTWATVTPGPPCARRSWWPTSSSSPHPSGWATPRSSVCRRILERLDAELSQTDGHGRLPTYGKVAAAAVVGNEDGAHEVSSDLFQGLNDLDSRWLRELSPTGSGRPSRGRTTRTLTARRRQSPQRPAPWRSTRPILRVRSPAAHTPGPDPDVGPGPWCRPVHGPGPAAGRSPAAAPNCAVRNAVGVPSAAGPGRKERPAGG
ncbi:hypothetical protein JOC24_003659 [Streptomyces sp. HB132]|nr:hypothetical protein [Streptomyces sp. HB132]